MKIIFIILLLSINLAEAGSTEYYDCQSTDEPVKIDIRVIQQLASCRNYQCNLVLNSSELGLNIVGRGYLNDDTIDFVSSYGLVKLRWSFDHSEGDITIGKMKYSLFCRYDYNQ